MLKKRKVVLFYPPYDGPPLGAPLCLLALASPLMQAKFEVMLIDAAIDLTIGQTSRVRAGCVVPGNFGADRADDPRRSRSAKAVKKEAPEVPVILGGWHPSLVTEQTLEETYVDAVVRGQGEVTLVEVAEALQGRIFAGRDCGSFLKSNVAMPRQTAERRVALLDDLPTPAFDLADFDAYERVAGEENWLMPPALAARTRAITARTWFFTRGDLMRLPAERVVREVTELVGALPDRRSCDAGFELAGGSGDERSKLRGALWPRE